jgi:hypothetical protein
MLHVESLVLKRPLGKASADRECLGFTVQQHSLEPIENLLMWGVHYVTGQPEVVYPEGLFDL